MLSLRRTSIVVSAKAVKPWLRGLCTIQDRAKSNESEWIRTQERRALDKLKTKMESKRRPINETDENQRLANILVKVGVRDEIREALSVELLLWKHDEDLMMEYSSERPRVGASQ